MRRLALLFIHLSSFAAAESITRREPDPRFAIDEAFQSDGGVQYFYELARNDAVASSAAFPLFRAFDLEGVWSSKTTPLHVLMSRIVYGVDKDLSFFTAARVSDPAYVNAIVPEYGIETRPDGGFRVTRPPANDLTMEVRDPTDVSDRALARILELSPGAGLPGWLMMQKNSNFARVMGWRTGEASFTWTAHFSLGPGRTRLVVFSISYVHNIPPFFLGGEARVFNESVAGALRLIDNLRAYRVAESTTPSPTGHR